MGFKGQGAMEFLLSYSWAIIIIAIIIGALFFLGIFGGRNIQPRAPPGSCYVYRSDGPGSLTFINLEGTCSTELPKYVSQFGYFGAFKEFGNSNITVPYVKFMPLIKDNNNGKITMSGWIWSGTQGNTQTAFAYGNFSENGPPWNAIFINTNESPLCNDGMFAALYSSYVCMYSKSIPIYTWMFVVLEYNGTKLVAYDIMNGGQVTKVSTSTGSFVLPAHGVVLVSTPWNGLISNVQLYNTSLSENSIMSLYREGLGGVPVDLDHLVGWWPLNGDMVDYSGNGNDGYPYNSATLSGSYDGNYLPP